MRQVTASGTRYNDRGEGSPLIFVHALGVNSKMWGLQTSAMSQRYRVISYDVRGHGLTPYSGEPMSIWTLADDLLELMDHLELEKAAIVGLSMGGVIAQAFAISHPERVTALGLVSTMSAFPEEARAGLRERARVVKETGMEPMVAPAIARWFTEEFRARAQAALDDGRRAMDDDEAHAIAAIRQMIRETNPKGYAAACIALAEADLTEQLGEIACPTLIMSGAQDLGVNRETQDTLRAGIDNSTEIIVAKSAHLIAVECPTEFDSHLLNFLAWSG